MIRASIALLLGLASLWLPLQAAEETVDPAPFNLLTNGHFECLQPDGKPVAWQFYAFNNPTVKMTIVNDQAAEGKNSLWITNHLPLAAKVFGVAIHPVPLQPGIRYTLSCRVKGKNVNGLVLAIGKNWNQRFAVTGVSDQWKAYAFKFQLQPGELDAISYVPLAIISEAITDVAWIDNLEITEDESATVQPSQYQNHRVYQLKKASLDLAQARAIPPDWPVLQLPHSRKNFVGAPYPAADQFSATVALGYDATGIILLAQVNDPVAVVMAGAKLWLGDSVQLRFDQKGDLDNVARASDLEVGFAVSPEGRLLSYNWTQDRELASGECQGFGQRNAKGYFLAARLNWSLLKATDRTGKIPFSFNVVVNQSNGEGHRDIAFLTPGLHDKKYSNFYTIAFLESPSPIAKVITADLRNSREVKGTFYLSSLASDVPVTISAKFQDRQQQPRSLVLNKVASVRRDDVTVSKFWFPLDAAADGPFTIEFSANDRRLATVQGEKIDLFANESARLAALEANLKRLRQGFNVFYGPQPLSAYVTMPLAVLDKFTRDLRQIHRDAASSEQRKFFVERALLAVPGQESIVHQLENRLKQLQAGARLPETWQYVSSPSRLVDGWPVATNVNSQGHRQARKTVFTGYGHFEDVVRDLPEFQSLGANVIQIEIGPSAFFPAPGKTGDFSEISYRQLNTYILPAMKTAWDNNVKIALLISPHYHMDWLLQKYPEMRSNSGFMSYEISHPKAREMMTAYLNALIPALKKSPYRDALHSITLSNEPVYTGFTLQKEFARRQFKDYLARIFTTVDGLNRAAGRHFADWNAVIAAGLDDPAVKSAFYTFKRQTFADWHDWVAGQVRTLWPEVPLSTKIMVFGAVDPENLDQGVDPELMGAFSDYNGNDNYMFYAHDNGDWASDWVTLALTHELQISTRPASICNTENHIIMDNDRSPVPADHVYTAIFQQYVTGASGIVTWVWVDINYERSLSQPRDLQYNIYMRPDCVLAQGLAALDGNRLSEQLAAFTDDQPETALLYSPTALILNGKSYMETVRKLYVAGAFSGYRLRFLSERQIEAGKFGKTKLLLMPNATNVKAAILPNLKTFVAQGGRVVTIGDCLKKNEYDQPLNSDLATTPFHRPGTKDDLDGELLAYLQSVGELPLQVKVMDADSNRGLFFRVVPQGKKHVVNIVNYNHEARQIKLIMTDTGKLTNLRSGSEQPLAFSLPPLQPLLLELAR